jgi:hypothetical protein
MFGTIRVNGEDLPLTKRGRLVVDVLSGVGVAVLLYVFIVVVALVGG